ncbi:hypothetical protein VNO77_50181 [Canavalia gladiata]|uniref:Uncharacterized protein n=1 Tax=Canavalia gladiata TaxID=3824 RepID=A0AAN9JDY2_CANGL
MIPFPVSLYSHLILGFTSDSLFHGLCPLAISPSVIFHQPRLGTYLLNLSWLVELASDRIPLTCDSIDYLYVSGSERSIYERRGNSFSDESFLLSSQSDLQVRLLDWLGYRSVSWEEGESMVEQGLPRVFLLSENSVLRRCTSHQVIPHFDNQTHSKARVEQTKWSRHVPDPWSNQDKREPGKLDR